MSYTTAAPLARQQLTRLLDKAKTGRVGLIGDLCLDMYWIADMKRSQLSRETPHYPLPIVQERYAPGGAGNVACNLADLKPASLQVLGVVGTDWRGDLLCKALSEHGICTENVVRDPELMTNTYIKPLRCGISDVVYEDPRLDFENRKPMSEATEQALLQKLLSVAKKLDVLCVSDQMEFGCITPKIREAICQLGKEGLTVIVDSRDRAGLYRHVIRKPNEVEAGRLAGIIVEGPADAAALCQRLSSECERPGIITLGSQGSMLCEKDVCTHVPACPVKPPLDFCGAGDTFLSGLGVMLAGGASLTEAAQVATLCSAVTVKKLDTTGTATHQELLAAHSQYFA